MSLRERNPACANIFGITFQGIGGPVHVKSEPNFHNQFVSKLCLYFYQTKKIVVLYSFNIFPLSFMVKMTVTSISKSPSGSLYFCKYLSPTIEIEDRILVRFQFPSLHQVYNVSASTSLPLSFYINRKGQNSGLSWFTCWPNQMLNLAISAMELVETLNWVV